MRIFPSETTRLAASLAILGSLLTACSANRDPGELFGPSEADVLVLDAQLIVGNLLPGILLSRTVAPGQTADTIPGEPGATISLTLPDGSIMNYTDSQSPQVGLYTPVQVAPPHRVREQAVYSLEVVTSRGEVLRARTLTPPAFSVDDWVVLGESLEVTQTFCKYQNADGDPECPPDPFVAPRNQTTYSEGLLEARFERPDVPAFQVGLFSLDKGSDFVIDPDFFEEDDFDELTRTNNSPPLSGEDGTLRLPWFAIFFEGRYQIKIYALDENWYDLARSDTSLGGGIGFGGNAGDQFDRPIFNVEGGIGLFGSASVDSVGFRVNPDE